MYRAPSRSRYKERYLLADGARLRYRDDGRGAAVLLIHGWTLDLDMWEPQVPSLAGAFRVIRLDRRGFGLSNGRPSIAQNVTDVQTLCRTLEIRRLALVGMSQGARVAFRLMHAIPESISCVVFDGPPDLDGPSAVSAADEPPFAAYRVLAAEHGIEAFRQEWRRHPLVQLRTRDPTCHRLLNRMIARYPGADLLASPERERPEQTPTESLDGPPALIVSGELDLASRRHAAAVLAERLPNAELAVIPEAGHLSNLDNHRVYNAVVRRFLECHARNRC